MARDVARHTEPAVLALADGTRWAVRAADEEAASIVLQLSSVMALRTDTGPACELVVAVDQGRDEPPVLQVGPSGTDGDGRFRAVYRLPGLKDDASEFRLYRVGSVLGLCVQSARAVLLHGALAELRGYGVILAGQSGTGKTTASARLPHPWRSLCDDTTLVVRDARGRHWAHPWPTWSRFFLGEAAGGSWDVQRAVPLAGIFFLEQSASDGCERVTPSESVGGLLDVAEQVSRTALRELGTEDAIGARVRRFEAVCKMAQAVPGYRLYATREGAFWQEVERALGAEVHGVG